MHAILLSIGDELVLGQTVDTNAAWLSARLSRLGVRTLEHRTIDDGLDTIAQAITDTAARCGLLIITGGLGPTDDDLTRPALAKAMGVELVVDPASAESLEQYFQKRGREMPQCNRLQAMHPQTSTMLENTRGTAPGIRAALGGCHIFVTPGVPHEMVAMFDRSIEPAVLRVLTRRGGLGRVILTTKINTFGSGESDIAERLGSLMARDRNPVVGTTVADGIVSVRVRAEYEDPEAAQRALAETAARVERHVGVLAFGREDTTLQEAVITALVERKLTVVPAESCTGGMVAAMLTDVPGSSAAVLGGWVTYANAMKTAQLGVPSSMIAAHGAVSEPVVRAMASGALERSGADLAVSTSGVAGPGGGTVEKPVGTVWMGLAWREGGAVCTDARVTRFSGDRDTVRDRNAKCALQLLRLHVLGEDLGLIRWAKQAGAL